MIWRPTERIDAHWAREPALKRSAAATSSSWKRWAVSCSLSATSTSRRIASIVLFFGSSTASRPSADLSTQPGICCPIDLSSSPTGVWTPIWPIFLSCAASSPEERAETAAASTSLDSASVEGLPTDAVFSARRSCCSSRSMIRPIRARFWA